jgi:hypothetical protein
MTTNGSTQSDTIPFDQAVAEGKEIVAKIADAERGQLRLGELADKVTHPDLGDRTIANFAKEIGIEKSTLYHYRSVYRHWKDVLPPGAKIPRFAVLKELETVDERAELIAAEPDMSKRRAEVHRTLKDHPKREEIRRKYPDLSCTKEARKIMASYDAGWRGEREGLIRLGKTRQAMV